MPKFLRAALVAAAVAAATASGATAAQAADTSCTGHAVCFWKQTNYRGDKYEVSVTDRGCWNIYPSQPNKVYIVRSLKVGGSTSISSMRTGQNCHGTPSMSYAPGARVPNTTFNMKSFR